MKQWKFYFVDNNQKRQLKYDVDEWKNFGINYGREDKTTILKSYSAGFTFIKEDAAYLREIVFTRGFNARIKLEIYTVRAFGVEVLEYVGQLDLTDPEIGGNTFKCPIYSGGFFTALENAWDDEFEIRAVEEFMDIRYNDYFKNFNFTGGEYELEKQLGLFTDVQNEGDVKIQMIDKAKANTPSSPVYEAVTFLPIKNIFKKRDSKLNFFNDADSATVKRTNNPSDAEISDKQCFIISPDKNNFGKIKFDGGIIGDIEVTISEPSATNYQFHVNTHGGHTVNYRLPIYFYKNVCDKWVYYDAGNMYNNTFTSNWNTITLNSVFDINKRKPGVNQYVLTLKDFYVPSFNSDLAACIGNTNELEGYKIAIGLEIDNIQLLYFKQTDGSTRYEKISDENITFIPNKNFTITYKNENFALNKNRIVHGIYHTDLFKALIDKINTKYQIRKTLPPSLSEIHRYNVNVVISNLEPQDFYLIASGTTLLGSKEEVNDAGITSGIRTSLKDFVDYMYKIHAMKLICTYDKNTNTYNLQFTGIRSCYKDTFIQKLDKVSDLTITSDRTNLYTSIKVGYPNTNDAIFGQLEYNTTNNFKTGNTELEHKELDLVSPYKAGALDIETFIHDKYHNFEDTQDGSGDVYFIYMDYNKNTTSNNIMNIKPRRASIPYGKIKVAFNTLLTPRRILGRHDAELSSYLFYNKILKFISSERNADFAASGINESTDLTLSGDNYTKPFIFDVKVPAVMDIINKIDANPLGYFEFSYNGSVYKGYIADGTESVSVNPMNEQASTLKLIAHKDSDL